MNQDLLEERLKKVLGELRSQSLTMKFNGQSDFFCNLNKDCSVRKVPCGQCTFLTALDFLEERTLGGTRSE